MPGQPEPVVGVQVRDEDLIEVGEADRAQQLALRALTAVDEDAVAAPADQHRGQTAALCRQRAAGSGEEDREFHLGSVCQPVVTLVLCQL